MNPITLEYLAIKVEKGFSLAAPAFASLRQTVVELGGVKEQYYGFTDDQTNQLLWAIRTFGIFRPVCLLRLNKLDRMARKNKPSGIQGEW